MKWIVAHWLTISFWVCVVCFFVNVVLIEIDLRFGAYDAASFQLFIAAICALGAFVQFLRMKNADGKPGYWDDHDGDGTP